MEELLDVVRRGQHDDLVGLRLLDHGRELVQRVGLDHLSDGFGARLPQGLQGHFEREFGGFPGVLALRFLALAGRFLQFAHRQVVDGPQQHIRLVATRLHQHDEGDLLLPVQGGDELDVLGGEGLLDHQNAGEHHRRPSASVTAAGHC